VGVVFELVEDDLEGGDWGWDGVEEVSDLSSRFRTSDDEERDMRRKAAERNVEVADIVDTNIKG